MTTARAWIVFSLLLSNLLLPVYTSSKASPNLPVATGTAWQVSVSSKSVKGNLDSTDYALQGPVAISAYGCVVAFESQATNLVSGDTDNAPDVFIQWLTSGQTARVSVSSSSEAGNHLSDDLDLSSDGGFVAYRSLASNLVSGDTKDKYDVSLHNLLMSTTERVSVSSSGAPANDVSYNPFLSYLAEQVVIYSGASTPVTLECNSVYSDVFLYDDVSHPILIFSRVTDGELGNRGSKSA